jgi:hypothetical protein
MNPALSMSSRGCGQRADKSEIKTLNMKEGAG